MVLRVLGLGGRSVFGQEPILPPRLSQKSQKLGLEPFCPSPQTVSGVHYWDAGCL